MIDVLDVDVVERVRRNTRLLLGEESDVSYITETLLARMERNGVEVSSESTFGDGKEQTYIGNRIVDAVRYVAFTTDGGERRDGDGPLMVWLEKPVEIVYSGRCGHGHDRYKIRKLHLSAA